MEKYSKWPTPQKAMQKYKRINAKGRTKVKISGENNTVGTPVGLRFGAKELQCHGLTTFMFSSSSRCCLSSCGILSLKTEAPISNL